ncbi:porin [Sulfurimonas sp.]
MKKQLLLTGLLATVLQLSAVENNGITIIDKNSPDFLLGKQTHINMKFTPYDAPDMWFKAGIRVQGSFENLNTKKYNTDGTVKSNTTIQDAYLRRVRLEVAAGFGKHTSFAMDIRNDKANKGINNDEGNFNVGDAYLKIKKPFNTSLVNFKLYRAKIDISRTETVKSARVIVYDRPYVADAAAQYISFNRRASNVQMYGNYKHKIAYQIASGAASSPDKIVDATGSKATADGVTLTDQSFFIGGKVVLSPFDGWEEKKRTETYFGKGKHFSIGAAYWIVPTLKGKNANGSSFNLSRKLTNLEISAHYKGLFFQSEYFKFDDMVKDWTALNIETGTSTGWYATSEYVTPELSYIAPFVRYEKWNRFDDANGYEVTSKLAGINWYLRGNTTKVGFVYQEDNYGINTGNKDVTSLRVTSQWFF